MQYRRNWLVFTWGVLACLLAGSALADRNWRSDLTVYANVPTLQLESRDGSKSQISRSDIISDLDFVFQTRGRVLMDRWSFTVDLYYFDIANGDSEPVSPGVTLDKLTLEGFLGTPSIGYRVLGSENDMASHLDVYLGARYLYIDSKTNLDFDGPPPPGGSTITESFGNWDALIGVRGRYMLSERWYIPYFADIGKGESDSAGQISAGLAYRWNRISASAGWRYIKYNLGSDSAVKELDASGPFVGVTFLFGGGEAK